MQVAFLLLLSLVLIILFAPLLKNSSGSKASKNKEATVTKSSDSYHLRDNSANYKTYNRDKVGTMYLTVSRGNDSDNTNHSWSEVNGLSVYDYDKMGVDRYKVAGLLQVGDEKGPKAGELGYGQTTPNASVQVRGQTSSRNPQKNYKIKIKDSKGSWYGQKTINLNKHQTDSLRFRNMMAYTLLQDIPQLLSLQTQFVHLYVKDTTGDKPNEFVDYGLYTQVEQLNKQGMKNHNLDSSGQLYKINFFEFYPDDDIKLATDPKYDQKKFETKIEIKGSTDHTKLLKLIKAVNNTSLDFDKVLDKNLDMENLSYWMAFQILIGNHDTQNRNIFLYSPLNSKRWYIIPWDNDGMLFKTEYQIEGHNGDASWETGISNYWGNMLFRRALQSKKFRKALDEAILDLRSNVLTNKKISSLSLEYAKVVEPYITEVPDSTRLGVSMTQYQQILAALPKEVEENYQSYKESLTKPMPFFIGTPKLNGSKLKLNWDSAFDFKAQDITYTVEVSKDYKFTSTIFKKANIKLTSTEMDKLGAGQYFIRVTAKNSAGKMQTAFDYYVGENEKYSGVKSFYVDNDGSVKEDTYEE